MPLLWMAGAFALGVALEDAAALPAGVWWVALPLAALLAALPRGRCAHLGLVGELLLGVTLGAGALAQRLGALPPQLAAGGELAELRVLAVAQYAPESCQVDVWVHGRGRPGRARVWNVPALCVALPGDRFLAQAELEGLRGPTNPGGRDGRRAAARAGMRVQLRLAGEPEPIHAPPGWRDRLARLRRALGDCLDPAEPRLEHHGRPRAQSAASDRPSRSASLDARPPDARPREGGALLRALALGDRSRLSTARQQDFAAAGLAHVLSVSGFHVTLVFGVARGAALLLLRLAPWARLLRGAPALAAGVGAGAAGFYALLAGLDVPMLRAVLMAAAGVISLVGGRPAAAGNALGLAALAALALEPGALFGPSFLLSFSAVAGILAWRPPRAAGAVLSGLHVSLAAGLASAPWLVQFGLSLPVASLLANALALPLFAVLTVFGLGVAFAGVAVPVSAAWLGPLARGGAELALALVGALASPDALSALPGAALPAALGLVFALFGARCWALGERRAAGALGALALLCALAPRAPQAAAPAYPSVLFFDVGHGDAILVREGARAVLIDAGDAQGDFDAGRSRVVPGLRALGVTRLDALVVTHPDRDHVGGAPAVLDLVPVGEVWLSVAQLGDPGLRALREHAARARVPLRLVTHGVRRGFGRFELAAAAPPPAIAAAGRNAASLVLRVGTAQGCALLPGDATAAAERVLAPGLGPCALLKLAHHGSRTSNSPEWLAAAAPALAVVSAGRRPRSPLPHRSVSQRLEAAGIPWLSTERSGAIEVELAPGALRVRSWAEGEPRASGRVELPAAAAAPPSR